MGPALTAQRWASAALASIALLWGGWTWGLVAGLWLAVWIVGLSCVGLGALIHEVGLRRGRAGFAFPEEERARIVKLSGFGYLSAGLLAGWFPIALTAAILAVALSDFLANHHVARTLTS